MGASGDNLPTRPAERNHDRYGNSAYVVKYVSERIQNDDAGHFPLGGRGESFKRFRTLLVIS